MYDSGQFALISDPRAHEELPGAARDSGYAILLTSGGFTGSGPVITHASAPSMELTGRSIASLQGQPLGQLFEPPWSADMLRDLRTELASQVVVRKQCQLRASSGGLHTLELEITRLVTLDDAPDPLHVVLRDALARQSMTRRIAGLLSTFEAVQSEVRTGTWIIDAGDRWQLRLSPELIAMFHLQGEHFTSDSTALTNCIHPDDRHRVITTLSAAVNERREVQLQHRVVLANQEERWVKVHTVPLEGASPNSYRVVGVVFDITSRILADASLRDAEQRYRAAADVGRDGLVFLNAIRDPRRAIVDFEISDVNQRACELLAQGRPSLVGLHLKNLVHLEQLPLTLIRFAEVVDTLVPYEATLHHRKALFQADWIQLQAVPWGDGLAVSVRNVSAEKQLEQQLARAQRLESIGRMATGIAHDFNNMLSAVVGFTTIARDSLPLRTAVQDDLEQSLIAAERASQLTRYLLTFASRQALSPELVQINAVLKTLTQILSRILGRDIQLELALEPKVVGAWLDASHLEQAIVNLATNARDAMPQGGTLRIATQVFTTEPSASTEVDPLPEGEYVCITVSDTGVGMDAATRDQVFEPFFTTKGPNKGTGLGLAMLYGFVKQSGGRVTVESTVGEGTQFRIYLPHRTGARRSDTLLPPNASGLVTQGHETVLLMDCDESVRRVARRILELHGYRVVEVANAGEAYFALENPPREIDLLLMSPHLPRIAAIDFVAHARRVHPTLAVVAMSGAVDQEALEAFVEATHAQFISKPLSPERLLLAVQQSLKCRPNGCATPNLRTTSGRPNRRND